MEKIYFAGSIRGGREDTQLYQEIIEHLKKYGEVLTEHIGDKTLTSSGETSLSAKEIHDRDMDFLNQSEYIVAEVTTPSLGVGYEIGRIIERNLKLPEKDKKKILCLYRLEQNKRISAMISGSKEILCFNYKTIEEAKKIIDDFFKNHN